MDFAQFVPIWHTQRSVQIFFCAGGFTVETTISNTQSVTTAPGRAPLTGKRPLEAHAHSGTGAEESMGAVILNDKDNVTGVSCVETLQQRDVDSGNGSVRHCP